VWRKEARIERQLRKIGGRDEEKIEGSKIGDFGTGIAVLFCELGNCGFVCVMGCVVVSLWG
jgi:hypothetical protein